MKKIKALALFLICIALTFALIGCKNDPTIDGYITHGKVNYHTVTKDYTFNFNLYIEVDTAGKYTLEYVVTLKDDNNEEVVSKNFSNDIEISSSDVSKGTYSIYGSFSATSNDSSATKAEVSKIKMSSIKVKDKTNYVNYAIGFGTAAAALLAGLITFFVIIKVKEKRH